MLNKKLTVSRVTAALVVLVAVLFGQDSIQSVLNMLSIFNAA